MGKFKKKDCILNYSPKLVCIAISRVIFPSKAHKCWSLKVLKVGLRWRRFYYGRTRVSQDGSS